MTWEISDEAPHFRLKVSPVTDQSYGCSHTTFYETSHISILIIWIHVPSCFGRSSSQIVLQPAILSYNHSISWSVIQSCAQSYNRLTATVHQNIREQVIYSWNQSYSHATCHAYSLNHEHIQPITHSHTTSHWLVLYNQSIVISYACGIYFFSNIISPSHMIRHKDRALCVKWIIQVIVKYLRLLSVPRHLQMNTKWNFSSLA